MLIKHKNPDEIGKIYMKDSSYLPECNLNTILHFDVVNFCKTSYKQVHHDEGGVIWKNKIKSYFVKYYFNKKVNPVVGLF